MPVLRRRLPLAVAGICLALTASAGAAPEDNQFTAVSKPVFVQPAPASSSYTITFTNDPSPSGEADRATITPPAGFHVLGPPAPAVSANVTGCGNIDPWTAEVLADGKLGLRRSGGSSNNLCPGGSLVVVFSATADTPGTYEWGVELRHGDDPLEPAFILRQAQLAVHVDGTAPETTINSGPPAFTDSTSASFTFSSEAGAVFQCSLDGGAFSACSSPKSYSGLAPGARTFEVRAIDQAGNVDASPATHSWAIDVTAPETNIDSGPPSLTNSANASFTFSSEAGATFQCRLDGEPSFTDCESPKSYTGLSGGTRTFRVRAVDQAGNRDPTPETYSWTIDLTAPQTTITSAPPDPTNATSASFSFSSSEAGSTFECNLDGAGFTGCPNPKSYSGLPGGARSFAVRATDPAGNVDASPATHSWRIDLDGPPTAISSSPPAATNSRSASFTFSSEAGTTFECSLDGVLFSACASPKGYDNLSDGPHSFAVRAVDAAKNTGPASARTWTIDTRPPAASVSAGPPALTSSRSAAFAFSADEASSFVCRLDGGAFQPCTSPTSFERLGDGAHTFVVRATDAVGNVGNEVSSAWTIDATAPETTLTSGPRTGTAATSATFAFRANEAVSFECRLDGAAFAPCTSPKRYARVRKTRHTFLVRAIDGAGNIDATPATHRWTIAAAPRTVKKTSALFAPEEGARVKAPPRLAWRPVRGAAYYNLQLYRRGVKVLSAWPTRPRLQLRARWTYLGRQRTLSPGTYRWFVWPAYKSDRYGRLLGKSTFVVTVRFR